MTPRLRSVGLTDVLGRPSTGNKKPAQKSLWRDMKLEGIHRQPKTYAVSETKGKKDSKIFLPPEKPLGNADTPMKRDF
jgi:hypothetical protein